MLVRRVIVLILALSGFACAACEPNPAPHGRVIPTQTEGTVHLEGDSVTLNTYYATGVSDDWFTSTNFAPGSTATESWTGIAARENVKDLVELGKVDTLVWALGLNDMNNHGGWTLEDELIWTDILQNTVPKESCIVLVKPWALEADTSRPPMKLHLVRDWMDEFARTHDNAVTIDWLTATMGDPVYFDPDGVHLAPGSLAAGLRDNMYHVGVDRCAA